MSIKRRTLKLEQNRKRIYRKFEWLTKSLENRNDALFSKYVPNHGNASTFGGELLRAINILVYGWNNDGDSVRWGQPHVRNAALFLADNDRWGLGVENLIEHDENLKYEYNKSLYEKELNLLAENIIETLEDEPDLFEEENNDDCTEGYWSWRNLDSSDEDDEDEEDEYDDDEDDYDEDNEDDYYESRRRLERRRR